MSENHSEDAIKYAEMESITRYLEHKGVAVDCAACGKLAPGWEVYPTFPQTPSMPVGSNGDFLLGGCAIEMLAMRCAHCGYVRLFDKSVFNAWKKMDEPR